MTATTKWFNTQKGYGFITDLTSKKDVFVHQSNIMMDGFRHLSEKIEYCRLQLLLYVRTGMEIVRSLQLDIWYYF